MGRGGRPGGGGGRTGPGGRGPTGRVGGRAGWYGPVDRNACTAQKAVRVCGLRTRSKSRRIGKFGEKRRGGWR